MALVPKLVLPGMDFTAGGLSFGSGNTFMNSTVWPLDTAARTILALVSLNDSTPSVGRIFARAAADGGSGISFSFGPAARTVTILATRTTTNYRAVRVLPPQLHGWFWILCTADLSFSQQAGAKMWVSTDGDKWTLLLSDGSSTNGSGTQSSSVWNVTLGCAHDNTRSFPGLIAAVAIWRRSFGMGPEAINPFIKNFFTGQPRPTFFWTAAGDRTPEAPTPTWLGTVGAVRGAYTIYDELFDYKSIVSGYTHPTLSNARMTSLTSTSGVPNVDYAF